MYCAIQGEDFLNREGFIEKNQSINIQNSSPYFGVQNKKYTPLPLHPHQMNMHIKNNQTNILILKN